jgi:hypothetical protein
MKAARQLSVSRDLFALFPTSLHYITTNPNTELEI